MNRREIFKWFGVVPLALVSLKQGPQGTPREEWITQEERDEFERTRPKKPPHPFAALMSNDLNFCVSPGSHIWIQREDGNGVKSYKRLA